MNWLSPFLTPAGLVELAIVAGVFLYLFVRFQRQNAQLNALAEALSIERAALDGAAKLVEESRAAGDNAAALVDKLRSVLVTNTLVWKRARLTSRNRSRRPEATLPQIFYAVTEEARYWQGAFVFIGLAGTLVCLGQAVAQLAFLVGRNAAETSAATGLKEVVAHMTAVFGGMGAAFGSTAAGVGFTLVLAGKINAQERGWERLREEVEEFSLLEIEPLAAQMMERTEELPRLEAAVKRMEIIANGFTQGIGSALESLQSVGASAKELREANEAIAKSLAASADTLDGAALGFAGASSQLAGGLSDLQSTIQTHGETLGSATREWNSAGQESLGALREAVLGAGRTFVELGELRRELLAENAKTHGVMLESALSSQQLARDAQSSALSLGADMKAATQTALSTLREEIARGLLRVSDAIEGGVQSEKLLLDQFRAVLDGMGEYALRVEETILALPASLGNEPLLLIENGQGAGFKRVGDNVSEVRQELVGLRGELREAIVRELPQSLGQSLSGLNGVGAQVETLRDELRGAAQVSQNLQANVVSIAAQVHTLNVQVAQMRASTARLDKGLVISWPGSRS